MDAPSCCWACCEGLRETTSVDEEGLSKGAGGRKALYRLRFPPSSSHSPSSRSPSFSSPPDATVFPFPFLVSLEDGEIISFPSLFCPPLEAEAEVKVECEEVD